ncbi:MAG: hypothetical protein ACJAY7_000055 [Pseudohongiellaceae bacterium]|jgi:hypothetical protein
MSIEFDELMMGMTGIMNSKNLVCENAASTLEVMALGRRSTFAGQKCAASRF